MKTFENDLTSRQWHLYNFYKKEFAKDPNAFLNSEYIYNQMREDFDIPDSENYPPLKRNTDWNNQLARREITDDILALKKSERIQVIIISNANGSKIATKDEAADILQRERESILNSLTRNRSQLRKIGLDGQTRIAFNREKEVYEVFPERTAMV